MSVHPVCCVMCQCLQVQTACVVCSPFAQGRCTEQMSSFPKPDRLLQLVCLKAQVISCSLCCCSLTGLLLLPLLSLCWGRFYGRAVWYRVLITLRKIHLQTLVISYLSISVLLLIHIKISCWGSYGFQNKKTKNNNKDFCVRM